MKWKYLWDTVWSTALPIFVQCLCFSLSNMRYFSEHHIYFWSYAGQGPITHFKQTTNICGRSYSACKCITNICGEMEAGHKYLTAATSHSVWQYKAAHDCLFGNAFRIKIINKGRCSSLKTNVHFHWCVFVDRCRDSLKGKYFFSWTTCDQYRVAPKCTQLQAILACTCC